MPIRLLILDLDGTIADTIGSIREAVNMTLLHYGFPERSYEQVRTAIGNGARELIRRCIPEEHRADEALLDRVLADYDANYGLTYDRLDGCYDGMYESLHALHASV